MAGVNTDPVWEDEVTQIEDPDYVDGGEFLPGGATGKANMQARQLARRTQYLKNNKVDKETGKGLSTNDYTTAEKSKLEGIAPNADVTNLMNVNNAIHGAPEIASKPAHLFASIMGSLIRLPWDTAADLIADEILALTPGLAIMNALFSNIGGQTPESMASFNGILLGSSKIADLAGTPSVILSGGTPATYL